MEHIIVQMPINSQTLLWATIQYSKFIIQKYSTKRNGYLLLSRALLHETLKTYFNIDSSLEIDYLAHGKPYFVNHPSIQFNITHTNHHMAIMIAYGASVGVDIETIQRRKNLQGLVNRMLKEKEIEWLDQQPDYLPSFFKLWSAKEAYLKTTGAGLTGLSELTLDLNNQLALGPIKEGYLYLKNNATTESFAFYYTSKTSPNLHWFDGEGFSRKQYEWQIIECHSS